MNEILEALDKICTQACNDRDELFYLKHKKCKQVNENDCKGCLYCAGNETRKIIEKQLTDLENINQKYNIDLIILFKAMENGAYFKNPYYRNEIIFIDDLWRFIDLKRKCFDIRMSFFAKPYDYCTGGCMFYFSDYGIKDEGGWALTKKELKNDK